MRKLIRTQHPDAIIAMMNGMEIPMVFATMFSGIPVFNSVRCGMPAIRWRQKLSWGISYHFAQAVVFQSYEMANKPWFKTITNRVVIPNPLPIEFSRIQVAIPVFERNKKIFTVGRLIREKNQKALIDAFDLVSKVDKEVTLHIYGEGYQKNELEEYVQVMKLDDKVYFEGNKRNAIRANKDAAMFVLSSVSEGYPNALIEAMAYGIPCVCARFSKVTSEIISDGENGLISELDPVSLSLKMIEILSNPKLAYRISVNATKIYRRNNSDRICKEWEKLLFGR